MNSSMQNMKSTSWAVPHQIPAGLEISRKYLLAWRFEQIEEPFFCIFLIYIMFSDNDHFKTHLSGLQMSNNPLGKQPPKNVLTT